ncbi:discoidin domain-containing protein [Pseudalkalibacillus decolorationis]|uniref:discoidin domain-containing protein n=1 Tax=Pseudalkalibacillus decolorationis TaxID=163879 RepID=UPI002148CA35|nr:discoidin domain-containing protein [Pseudalkalibacillus decolorationis]
MNRKKQGYIFRCLFLCSLILVLGFSLMKGTPATHANSIVSDEKSYEEIADSLGNLAYGKQVEVSNFTSDGNIAYKKPVEASNVYADIQEYNGGKAVDGDPATRWATDVSTVTLEVDFGSTLTFDKIELTQFSERILSYKIEYWNGSEWLEAYTGGKAKAGYTNVADQGKFTPETAVFSPVTGSKVRLNITDSTFEPSIWEFKVFNTKENTGEYRNSMYNGNKAVDANPGTRWATDDNIETADLIVNLGEEKTFNKIVFKQLEQRIVDYKIEYWNGSDWKDAYVGKNPTSTDNVTFAPVTGSKVKFNISKTTGGLGPSIFEFEVINTKANKGLSRGSKVLVENGMQQQAWITTDETGRHYPTAEEWNGIHFTTATYYEAPLYNDTFHKSVPDALWSIAKAPYAEHLDAGPTSDDHFLNEEQRAHLDSLVSMAFGDEEGYTTEIVGYLNDWYDLSRKLYPNALVHNNQWAGQWSQEQLRLYMRAAKPDLLTFDNYYFSENSHYPGGSVTGLYNSLNYYRTIALEGYDGTGQSPIPFGQYTLGYKTGDTPPVVGPYVVSESQINIVSFATWTMGGKWTNLFRWEDNSDVFLFYDEEGNLTPQYYQYAEMAEQGNNLGDLLVRLDSTDVRFIPGEHIVNNEVVTNRKPDSLELWDNSTDSHIQNINIENIGNANAGLKGDVLIGYFEPLPGLPKEELEKLPSKKAEYFMIMNGLTAEGKEGSSENTSQTITLDLDVRGQGPKSLFKVNKDTGQIEQVKLTHVKGYHYKVDVTIGGGKADLFFWK